MDNIIGAVVGILLLVAAIAMFPIAFAFFGTPNEWLMIPFFAAGVLLLSAVLPVPVFILEKLDR